MSRAERVEAEFVLTDAERAQLRRWSDGVGSARLAVRAKIVLACAEPGVVYERLAAELGATTMTVLAEHAGDRTPDRMQRLLNDAVWDTTTAMGVIRRFVAEHLAPPAGGLAVAALDETGQEKKGSSTAGVKRQYMGYAGQVADARAVAMPAGYSWTPTPSTDNARGKQPRGALAVYVPETLHTSRDLLILVGHPTESVAQSEGIRVAGRTTDARLLSAMTAQQIFTEATSVYDNYVGGAGDRQRGRATPLRPRPVRADHPAGRGDRRDRGHPALCATCWRGRSSRSTARTSSCSTGCSTGHVRCS